MNQAFDGFAPELYLAALVAVARADGLQPLEQELLAERATAFGLELERLPPLPEDLSFLPWATRVLVYRDAVTLAMADTGALNALEIEHLSDLAARMGVPESVRKEIEAWVIDHGRLLERLATIAESAPDSSTRQGAPE